MNAPVSTLLLKPDEIDFSAWAYADERNRIVTPEMMHAELAELFVTARRVRRRGLGCRGRRWPAASACVPER